MNDSSKVLAGLLVGLAAGAVIGMLFVFVKGTETRDKLSESLKDLGDSIKDRIAGEADSILKKA